MATTFCQLIGVDLPIVAFSHCRDVVAAVSRAGGIGVFGAAKFSPEELDIELSWIDEKVQGRPYGVDVLAPLPADDGRDSPDLEMLRSRIPEEHMAFMAKLAERYAVPETLDGGQRREFGGSIVSRRSLEQQIDVALNHPIKFLVSGLGPFAPDVVKRAHAQNVVIGGMCGTVTHAQRHVNCGADVVIAQGAEAGGHCGEIGTLVLTPQVVDAVAPVPVLAAGGISTGRQLAAVLALGAQGAWIGSAWLTTDESDVDPVVITKLLEAESNQTVRTRCVTGKPARLFKTGLEEAWEEPGAPSPLPPPLQGLLVLPLIRRAFRNRIVPLMGQAVGQAVGMMKSRRTCKATVDEMMVELVDTLERIRTELDLAE